MYQSCRWHLFESCHSFFPNIKARVLLCRAPTVSGRPRPPAWRRQAGSVINTTICGSTPAKQKVFWSLQYLCEADPEKTCDVCMLCWPCSSPSARILEREVEMWLKDHLHMSEGAAAPPGPGGVNFKRRRQFLVAWLVLMMLLGLRCWTMLFF